MIRLLLFATLLASPATTLAGPPAGQIDPSFGAFDKNILGLQLERFDVGEISRSQAYAMAHDAQGGLILAGRASLEDHQCIALMRFTADGKLDTAGFGFDTDHVAQGKICHPFPLPLDNIVYDFSIAMLTDGGFFIGANPPYGNPIICRYNADGSKMDSFGNGSGCIILSQIAYGSGQAAPILNVLDASLLIISDHQSEGTHAPVLIRVATDSGEVEPFGNDMFLPLLSGDSEAYAWDAILTNDDDLIIVGDIRENADDADAFVARFDLQERAPDLKFSGDGVVRFAFNRVTDGRDYFSAVEQLPDGDILVGGSVELSDYRSGVAIAQIDVATGQMAEGAETFNDGIPRVYYPCFARPDGCSYMRVESIAHESGRVIISGEAGQGAMFAARLKLDGTTDVEFGQTGLFLLDLGVNSSPDGVTGMVLQGQRIVLAGSSVEFAGEHFALLRLSDGRLFKDEFEVVTP